MAYSSKDNSAPVPNSIQNVLPLTTDNVVSCNKDDQDALGVPILNTSWFTVQRNHTSIMSSIQNLINVNTSWTIFMEH